MDGQAHPAQQRRGWKKTPVARDMTPMRRSSRNLTSPASSCAIAMCRQVCPVYRPSSHLATRSDRGRGARSLVYAVLRSSGVG